MKRQFFLLCLTAGIIGISGCRNDALEEAVSFSIGEPTRTEFTFQAGLGSVSLQVSGSVSVTAESSAPEWCRVAVYDNSTVVYNVDTNRSEESRSATVTISADGFPSESFDIIQGPLAGLVVTPTELTFSDDETEISIEVIAACEYDIVEVENPDNTFSWEKSQDGSVITFSSPLPGVYAQEGQVNLVPKLAEGETLEEATAKTIERQNSEAKRYMKYYGIDIGDRSVYDLILNTDDMTPDQVMDTILAKVREWDARQGS